MSAIPHTGTDVGGVIEVRGPDGCRTARDRRARECLFGCPGGLQVDRPLFDERGVPEGAREDVLDDEADHSHSYAARAEVAAVDRDAPLNDRADGNHVGVWLPGPDGELVLDHVTGTPPAVLDAAEELFGEDLWPFE